MLEHIRAVSQILKKQHADEVTLCAGLLHDTIEDTDTNIEEIEKHFGREISFLVDGLTKSGKDWKDDLERIRIFSNEDRRIIIIRIADIQDNLNNVPFFKKETQYKIKVWFLSWLGLLSTLVQTETEKCMLERCIRKYKTVYN